ncbi:MAG: diguanylate cyclase [Wenzhouxiangella sp.]|nr:diguanylate cyclase [Wenzhouxiangella sp.]
MKVLFVDHSKVFRSVWERMVLHAGHEPLIASDGLTGLRLLDQQDVDFICVSLSLPDIDGIRFTRHVRTMPNTRSIPIVLLTSAQDNQTRRRAFEAGATDICPKTGIEDLFNRAARMTSRDDQQLSGRVLYVEDSRTVFKVMTRLMEGMGLTVDHFVSATEAYKKFDDKHHDLVISDILVEGDMSGIALVSQLREQHPDKTRVPILAMSGMDDEIRRVELFRLGINDFITKPVIREEAAARIRNLIVQKQLFDKVQQQRIQLYEMAMTDPLTGLYNRNSLAEFASKITSAANRHDMDLSVVIIDLDHFKQSNDEHGHLVGDQALASIGAMLTASCREEDFAVRFGGEEILLILPHCPLDVAEVRARQLRERIEKLRPAGIDVTASLGVSSRPPGRPIILEQLIRLADQAVYEAKSQGRNRVVVHRGLGWSNDPSPRAVSAA